MTSPFSNVANNLAEGIHKINCKYGLDDKNMKPVELDTKIVTAFLNRQTLKIVWKNTNDYVAITIIKKGWMKT